MTNEEKLARIKIMLSVHDDEEDEKLENYLDLAEKEILGWLYSYVPTPLGATVPAQYEVTQMMSVVVAISVEGAEGEETHIENGIHRKFNYDTMVSYIRSHVYPYAGV